MALLTAEEKEKLREKGLYVREKCDGCGDPLLTPFHYVKNGKQYDQKCRDNMVKTGEWKVKIKVPKEGQSKEEATQVMATKTAAKASGNGAEKKEKVGGHYRGGSTLANLYESLCDEKVHNLKALLGSAGKGAKDPEFLLKALKKDGEKKFKEWAITITDTTVQMKLGKAAASAAAKTPPPPKAATKSAPAKPPASAKAATAKVPAPSKAQQAVASMLRRTLKSATNWTKNKLVEAMKTKSGIDQKSTLAALAREISLGGVIDKKGVISLA